LNFSLLYAVQPLGHVKTKSKLPEYDLNVSTLNSHPNTIPFHPISSLFSPACLPNRAIIHQARQVMLLEAVLTKAGISPGASHPEPPNDSGFCYR
jgi:hypothetical protein